MQTYDLPVAYKMIVERDVDERLDGKVNRWKSSGSGLQQGVELR